MDMIDNKLAGEMGREFMLGDVNLSDFHLTRSKEHGFKLTPKLDRANGTDTNPTIIVFGRLIQNI